MSSEGLVILAVVILFLVLYLIKKYVGFLARILILAVSLGVLAYIYFTYYHK